MSFTAADVIILGLGGMGSAVAAHLARRGARVLGLEQYPFVHNRGSSHGDTRIIRLAYFEHPDYVPLLRRSYQLWQELESITGQKLLEQTGLLIAGPPDGEAVSGTLRAAREHRLPLEQLPPGDFRQRFPGLELPDGHAVLLETAAGFLHVERCVATHLEVARQHGAELRSETPVRSVWREGSKVVVQTDQDRFVTERLVVTAGAWTTSILQDLGVPLVVRRKFLGWFETDYPGYQREQGFPCFYIEQGPQSFYGFPSLDRATIKVAEHTGGEIVTDPAAVDRSGHDRDIAPLRSFLQQHFPHTDGRLQRHSVCLYTLSSDQHFVVDRVQESPNQESPHIVVACGFSGHGFKFCSVMGEVLADLALTGQTSQPIGFLSRTRFSPQ